FVFVVPPKDACLVPTNDTTLLKKIGEKWHSNQPCLSYTCSYGPDGLPLVIGEKKVCETTCNEGFEYIVEEGKCCGNCIQTMCNYNQTFYKPGDIWYSDDNCTTFKCEIRETNFFIEVSTETCPDVATCPDNQKYEDGCCIRCKLQPDSQKNCLPVSMVDTETVGIIQIYEGKHGLCKNKDVIYGFTECQGSCSSGSKFNPATHIQETFCHCCKPEKYDLLPVTLKCNDGSTTTKQIQIPSSCSCSPCSENIPFSEVDAEYVKIGKGVDAKKKYSTKNRGAKKG
ncbi:hemocytin-like, partial [Hermetia illucens]|uniref:hemocytin-like n=1 Tax=Hermetia illucens TaxID=343691 RepID=UPI0018CC51F6